MPLPDVPPSDGLTIDEVMRLLGARDLEIYKLTKKLAELQDRLERLDQVPLKMVQASD